MEILEVREPDFESGAFDHSVSQATQRLYSSDSGYFAGVKIRQKSVSIQHNEERFSLMCSVAMAEEADGKSLPLPAKVVRSSGSLETRT